MDGRLQGDYESTDDQYLCVTPLRLHRFSRKLALIAGSDFDGPRLSEGRLWIPTAKVRWMPGGGGCVGYASRMMPDVCLSVSGVRVGGELANGAENGTVAGLSFACRGGNPPINDVALLRQCHTIKSRDGNCQSRDRSRRCSGNIPSETGWVLKTAPLVRQVW